MFGIVPLLRIRRSKCLRQTSRATPLERLRHTLIAFDPAATREDQQGGHFILKVDIEGGEFPLFKQAAEDGTICEYVKMGNHADLYVEVHPEFGNVMEHIKKLRE
jgi:hypothetical protein